MINISIIKNNIRNENIIIQLAERYDAIIISWLLNNDLSNIFEKRYKWIDDEIWDDNNIWKD